MARARLFLRYVAWRLGLQAVLPGDLVTRVPIRECGEPLVRVATSPGLEAQPRFGKDVWVRKDVLRRLELAASALPSDLNLIVAEGFRTFMRQKQMWHEQLRQVSAEHPNLTGEEIERLARLRVATPGRIGGGHQTGGAVDVSLGNVYGEEVEMGTGLQEFTPLTPTLARPLPRKVVINRRRLLAAMKRAGFNNYPAEWWHFSFGDQLWAAYKRSPFAMYGPIESTSYEA